MNKIFLVGLLLTTSLGEAQTIAEKIAQSVSKGNPQEASSDSAIKEMNHQLISLREKLDTYYKRARVLHAQGADEHAFGELLAQVNEVKEQMHALEQKWHQVVVDESKGGEEGYALWDQEETTLPQLIMEYGALDYLYIVPPEMATMKLNMHSNVPIPRESWSEVLEIILSHNGVGVKKINPYARQLYVMKQDPSAIEGIASSQEELAWIPDHQRIVYVFSPPVEQVKSAFQFFERFADTKQTFVYQVGPKIAIVSPKEEISKLLELYGVVWNNAQGKVSKVVPVTKMAVKEMEKILSSFFGEAMEKGRPPFGKVEQEGLTVFSLTQGNALVLIGQQEVVDRGEKVVKETEDQLHDPAEMTVYLYNCRHSNPDDLGKVLEKVYASLLLAANEGIKETEVNFASQGPQFKTTPDGYAQTPPLVVAPPPIKVGSTASIEVEQGNDHFISDPKTGNLLMVVRRDALGKIKELLRKLDVPKKMVRIEVLLFEKRIKNENSFGLNLLKLGHHQGLKFTSEEAPQGSGVLQFLFHGAKSKHFPAYDLAYSFLMSQEDTNLNASPSVITVNQTPATINIVEEISINNGAAPVDTNKGIAFEKSYTRTQYGITINMTPTVHLPDDGDPLAGEKGCVTLQTNISFDTPSSDRHDDRPLVHRRHVENEVRVQDGETIILGGLRRKLTHDNEERIPFLGQIPILGKFFGTTKLTSSSTEMFVFITPQIVRSPQEELIRLRTEELKKRPGDIPEFLEKVERAREKERKKYFLNSLKIFLETT